MMTRTEGVTAPTREPKCRICEGFGWVCESHPNKAWTKRGCKCDAGVLCQCSRHLSRADIIKTFRTYCDCAELYGDDRCDHDAKALEKLADAYRSLAATLAVVEGQLTLAESALNGGLAESESLRQQLAAAQRVAEAANAFVPRDIGTWELMALAGFIPETQVEFARAVADYRAALAPQRINGIPIVADPTLPPNVIELRSGDSVVQAALAPQPSTVRDHHQEAMRACDEQRWPDAIEAEAAALARAVRLNTSPATQSTLAKSVIGICTAIQKALTPEPTARCGDCDACMTGQPCNRTILEPRREEC